VENESNEKRPGLFTQGVIIVSCWQRYNQAAIASSNSRSKSHNS
jgi:hypothetical protein